MTTDPGQSLIDRIADEFQDAYPHAFRLRSDAEDACRIALASCRAEEALALLRQIRKEYGMQFHTVCGQTLVAVDKLLAELDGRPGGRVRFSPAYIPCDRCSAPMLSIRCPRARTTCHGCGGRPLIGNLATHQALVAPGEGTPRSVGTPEAAANAVAPAYAVEGSVTGWASRTSSVRVGEP